MHRYDWIGACSWVDCEASNCSFSVNKKGKIINLPACDYHKKYIREFHSLYKRVGKLYSDVDISNLRNTDKIITLKMNCMVLTAEIEHRLEFTKNLKEIYRDMEHSFYVNKLIDEACMMLKQIDNLESG